MDINLLNISELQNFIKLNLLTIHSIDNICE